MCAEQAVESPGQCVLQAPDAKAKIQPRPTTHTESQLAQTMEQEGNLTLTALHELLQIPSSAGLIRKRADGPQRIARGVAIPVLPRGVHQRDDNSALKMTLNAPMVWPRHCGRKPSMTTWPAPRSMSSAAALPFMSFSPSR